ncbi:MAG TPA: hypothetical protein VNY73_02625 [Bacteroidia bacterium]|jgi:hypothetical protein|nr:hypothetical protein [Bacteroidia bacterium]
MKAKQEFIYSQHHENNTWANKLFFYKDEISIMENRLREIAAANTAKEVMARVEHFQNQLIVQRNNIDAIKHALSQNDALLEKSIEANPTATDHRKMAYHTEERETMEAFEKNFNELRSQLKQFLTQWL